MPRSRSRTQRVIALACAVILIGGGATTLGTVGSLLVSKIFAVLAIIAGLYFLSLAARSSSARSS